MIGRVMALVQRVQLLAIVAGATAVILAVPRKAAGSIDPVCRSNCAAAFGVAYWSADQFYVLSNCGPTGDGRTWCEYVSVN